LPGWRLADARRQDTAKQDLVNFLWIESGIVYARLNCSGSHLWCGHRTECSLKGT
jgi:hypothetical protein